MNLADSSDSPRVGSGSADLALVKRVQQGDRAAFDLLVVKYQHRILKLIMRYVKDPAEALDVAQEAFLKAYRGASSFRGDSAFYTWLYRIAINTAKNHLVSANRRSAQFDFDMQENDQSEVMARLQELDTPEALAMSEQLRAQVLKTIAELPEDLRTAIVLREVEGMSYEEIAQTMQCPVGTVRSRIFRAREAIDKSIGAMM